MRCIGDLKMLIQFINTDKQLDTERLGYKIIKFKTDDVVWEINEKNRQVDVKVLCTVVTSKGYTESTVLWIEDILLDQAEGTLVIANTEEEKILNSEDKYENFIFRG